MLNMVSVAQTTADENTVQLEESMKKTREMEGKMEKQRRHSRELEQEVFGMHLKDAESLPGRNSMRLTRTAAGRSKARSCGSPSSGAASDRPTSRSG